MYCSFALSWLALSSFISIIFGLPAGTDVDRPVSRTREGNFIDLASPKPCTATTHLLLSFGVRCMVVNNQAACDDNYVNRPHDLSILGNSANFVITDHQSSSMITKALVDARITWTCGLQTVMIYPDWDKKILCLVNHDYQDTTIINCLPPVPPQPPANARQVPNPYYGSSKPDHPEAIPALEIFNKDENENESAKIAEDLNLPNVNWE